MNQTTLYDTINDKNHICCVVIPIYKSELSKFEIISLNQCCKILKDYYIIFVTHNNLDCKIYNDICNKNNISYKYEYFNKQNFVGIDGYNALLLSKRFYKRFIDYEYILIYQLDAFIFRDELEYWCKQGYDYIGAPWLKINSNIMPEFTKPPRVGNGGFSLRNINKFFELYNTKIRILSLIHLFQSKHKEISFKSKNCFLYFIPRILLYPILKFFRFFFFNEEEAENNEDVIWSKLFQKKGYVPDPSEAAKFAFECYPEYLYGLNNAILPFGCHSWYNYYHYLFYKQYIMKEYSHLLF